MLDITSNFVSRNYMNTQIFNKKKNLAAGCIASTVVAASLALCQIAEAADTVETWDVGATNVDFYVGFDGIGLGKYDKTIYGDIMLGYGLIEHFSAYLGTTLQANEHFSAGEAATYFGVFGTPVDIHHFDFDLFLGFSLGGPEYTNFQLEPSTEFNFDLDPDQGSWGMYLRAGVPLYGRARGEDPDSPEHEIAFHIETTIGTYLMIADGHQAFLEYDMGFLPRPAQDEDSFAVGGVAFGYNVGVHDTIEMINQVFVDIPQGGEDFSVGLMTGIIVTLPAAE